LVQEHPLSGWIWRSWNDRQNLGCSDKNPSVGQVPTVSRGRQHQGSERHSLPISLRYFSAFRLPGHTWIGPHPGVTLAPLGTRQTGRAPRSYVFQQLTLVGGFLNGNRRQTVPHPEVSGVAIFGNSPSLGEYTTRLISPTGRSKRSATSFVSGSPGCGALLDDPLKLRTRQPWHPCRSFCWPSPPS
jgi:hypothetical protein